MNEFKSIVVRFVRSEWGPTTTEYAVMLGLIIALCVLAISSIGQKVSSVYSTLSSGLPTGGGS